MFDTSGNLEIGNNIVHPQSEAMVDTLVLPRHCT